MHLVVGLGNPGEEYARTPHNLGFLVIDRVAERNGIRVSRRDSRALTGLGEIAGRAVMLAKPQTFMNLSGASVGPLMEKHEIAVSNVVAICDEMNLPWGTVRVRAKGSPGGHNGMKSLVDSLGTQEFCRVRLGVDPGHPVTSGTEYLLAPMRRSLEKELDEMVGLAAEAVESIIAEGVEKSMTKHNRRAQGSIKEEE